jgi:Tc5 transposase DNA-binding domain
MPNNHCIPEAIADLETQEVPNIAATAKKYGLDRTTLSRRWRGKTVSMEECVSTHRQCLTNTQEKVLVDLINRLTDRGMPPTPRVVKNLAEEIRGCQVGKNWTGSFVQRHQKELKSLYLRCIDNLRVKGEYPPAYQLFYDLVKSLPIIISILLNNKAILTLLLC